MGLIASLVTFVIGALVGGLGIYVGAAVVAGKQDYEKAVWTAVIGSLVWTLVGTFFGWIPLLGPILTLGAYLTVVNIQYPGGWIKAAGITLIAWVTLVVVFTLLGPFGLDVFSGVGVPGV
jgi:hypothetical protein